MNSDQPTNKPPIDHGKIASILGSEVVGTVKPAPFGIAPGEPTNDREQPQTALDEALTDIATNYRNHYINTRSVGAVAEAVRKELAALRAQLASHAEQPPPLVSQEDVAAVEKVCSFVVEWVKYNKGTWGNATDYLPIVTGEDQRAFAAAWPRIKATLAQPARPPSEPTIQSAIRDMCAILCNDKATDDDKRMALSTLREAIEPSPEIDLEKGWPEAPSVTVGVPVEACELIAPFMRQSVRRMDAASGDHILLAAAYVQNSVTVSKARAFLAAVEAAKRGENPWLAEIERLKSELSYSQRRETATEDAAARYRNIVNEQLAAVTAEHDRLQSESSLLANAKFGELVTTLQVEEYRRLAIEEVKKRNALEAELEAARPIVAKAAELRDECDRLVKELVDVKVTLQSYQREFKHAVECVDRVFQEDSDKSPPLLPDFLLGGADKFEGVVKLAEAYLKLGEKLAEAEARPKAIPWPLVSREEFARVAYEAAKPWGELYGWTNVEPWLVTGDAVSKMLREKLEQTGVVFEEQANDTASTT